MREPMSTPGGDNILKNRLFLKTFLSVLSLTTPGTPASIQLRLQLQQQQQQQKQQQQQQQHQPV